MESKLFGGKFLIGLSSILGISFTGIFGVMLVVGVKEEGIAIGVILFPFVALGIFSLFYCKKLIELNYFGAKYYKIISTKSIANTEELAKELGVIPEVVNKHIHELIKYKYIKFDYRTNCILFGDRNIYRIKESTYHRPSKEISEKQVDKQEKTVTCPNCGGINKIRSEEVQDCEFCGSPIQ